MALVQPTADAQSPSARTPIVNDFCITFSTINGSGSATANTTVLRALFRMGIPVSGKNIFPSNIQGLPTWYTIRVSKDGYIGRVEEDDIVIAMNPATFTREVESLKPGGVLLYPDDFRNEITRNDIFTYPMPVKKLVKESDTPNNLRDYIANMVYVGVLAQMIGIELEKIYMALDFHFKGKKKAIDSNYNIITAAAECHRRLHQGGWQHGRRAGFDLRRRAVHRLVSHYPGFLVGRGAERIPAATAERSGDGQEHLYRRTGRG